MIKRVHLTAEFDDDLLEVRAVCGLRAGSTPGGKPHPSFTPEIMLVTCQRCMAIATKGRKAAFG